ncbi:bifunctional hydroxymethylpyrimidine kinase/phosphomethylpyrimidine kinase [Bifidobacterium vespertilionis]|uniref:pyridoxal kinase n=1 Tax=Bifidobacterium vespertilionis TaxID=2562524 RepID=A0A5J5DYA2_9BIFI|nr:bifunctional hydroxymethylpyrimidine kinase/phosphomethylpyrimidine kinase [Bifidobacterium vespertilionis]KAA8821730.1 pyridoxine kinase [Bifidobacterium vespertilionis]KAA8824810.1 pyridoxine kinase [Bifidobacterium vespertilionis]
MTLDVKLYDRDPRYIPRVAAVHDMCGYGTCSLTAAIAILSAAGCNACPVPTALFSAHTLFPVYTFHDTTAMLDGYLDAWKSEGVDLDAVYSGFLGSAAQVAVIERLWRDYPRALKVVDPVMGDNGEIYPTYTQDMCRAMGRLASGADILLPNLTEAAILTGRDYPGQNLSDGEVTDWLSALLALGARHVVLKGVDRGDGLIRNYVAGAETGAEACVRIEHRRMPFMAPGTGDVFASALCGAVMAGRGLAESARIAGEFVRSAMEHTPDQPGHELRGASFELSLGQLTALVRG